MAAKIFRINYKSDFILTMNSEAGWTIPFCIKFWTSIPMRAYYVGFDGTTYTHCAYDPAEPTKLLVQFDDHHLPIGNLHFQIAYHFTVEDFPNNTEDEVFNATPITTEIDGETYQVMLDFTGETAPGIDFNMPSVGVTSVNGKIGAVTLNAEDVGAQPMIEDLATIRSGAAAGATAVQPTTLQEGLATKQNVIEDLATIRSGAAAGATAVQPATLQEGLATKQDVISDLATIRNGAAAGATAVQPAGLTPIQTALQTIEAVIPSAASSQNQLADKNFVNSSIATNTANFVGTYNSLAELQAVQNPTNNDYGFVIETDAQGNEYYDRYKYVAASQQWLFEYKVESTPFTAAQWAAIQSGITSTLVTKLNALPTNTELQQTLDGKANTSDIPTALSQLSQDSTHRVVTDAEKSTWNGKQNAIDDLATIRSGAAAGAEAAVRPYNTQSPDGMGYLVLDKDSTFASQVTTANTIYEIRYDYDLNAETVTLPANCVLNFNGGSVTNGNITCNNTLFEGDIRLNEVVLNGTIQNASVDISWFGIKFTSNSNQYSAVASANDTIIANYLFPSCVNIGKTLTLSNIVRISVPISINGFCVDCGIYGFAYHGSADLNGAVVTINGSNNNHTISVLNYSTSGSFDVRKDYGIIGVDCNGVNNSIINIKIVDGFTTGVRISSTSVGNAYNVYNIIQILDCYKGLVFYRSGSGYVNENIINKGRIWCSSSSVFSSKNIAISFVKEDGASNSNIFNNLTLYQPSVEGAGVAIYANSVVRFSRIIDIRNEGVITFVQDDSTDVIGEGACVITPYNYLSYITTYNTFIIKGENAFEKYPNYTTYLKGLIYNEDEKSICFADAFAVDFYAAIGSFLYFKNTGIGNYTQSDITTTNAVNIAMGVGLLFKRKTGNSLIGSVDVSNSSGTASARFGVILLKNDMKYFTQDELSGVKTNLGAVKLSSIYTYIYYVVGTNTAGSGFSFNNIPSDVTYMMVSAAGTFSKIKMAINDAWELIPPDGVIKIAAKKAKNSYGYLANTPVMYLNNENKLCVFLKDSNGVVTNKYADGTDIPDE